MQTHPQTLAQRSLIIAAASARSLAQSAVAAGFRVFCVDCFGDEDLRELLEQSAGTYLGRAADLDTWPQLLDSVPPEIPLLWAGGLENHLAALSEVARSRPLLGLPLNIVRALRQPEQLATLFDAARSLRVQFPETRLQEPPATGRWLWKPAGTSGGLGVQRLTDDLRLQLADASSRTAGSFQKEVDGLPCSVVVAADGHAARIIGLSLQFSGWPELNAAGFRFCGNIGPLEMPPRLVATLGDAVQRLLESSQIPRGIFGLDFLLTTQLCWLLEINPRIPASHWIYETPGEWNAVSFLAQEQPLTAEMHGQRRLRTQLIVWARRQLRFPQAADVLLPSSGVLRFADRPAPNTIVPAGTPICSVLAEQPPGASVQEFVSAIGQFPVRLADMLQFQPAAVAAALSKRLRLWSGMFDTWT
jgi:predicted ATP-grasp superfamily ATP-dependent carboligase